MGKKAELQVSKNQCRGIRLDVFLSESDLSISRSQIKKLIKDGSVEVNNAQIKKPSWAVQPEDIISVEIPDPTAYNLTPEAIPLDILFEDEDLVVVNKPAGMITHPASGFYTGTLVNALLYHCRDLSGINGVLRPGIVHRLDKDTSGLLMVAKNDRAHICISEQLKERSITRKYRAFVWGKISSYQSNRIEAPIGRHRKERTRMSVMGADSSKYAATRFHIENEFDFISLVTAELETGRTHQIRVHFSFIGHPIFGDPLYGGREKKVKGIASKFQLDVRRLLKLMPRQALHAQTLGFVHPRTKRQLSFSSDMPEDMRALQKTIESSPHRFN